MSLESPQAQLAMNPETSPEQLYQLSIDYPEVRELIAGHPNAYPALLEWLGGLGDPAIDAALSLRSVSSEVESRPSAEETEVIDTVSVEEEPGEPDEEIEDLVIEEKDVGEEFEATELLSNRLEEETTVLTPADEQAYMWTEADLLAVGSEPETSTTEAMPAPVDATAHYPAAPAPTQAAYPAQPASTPPPAAPASARPAAGGQGGKIFVYILLGILTACVIGVIVYLFLSAGSSGDERETVVIEDQFEPEPEPAPAPAPEPEPEPQPEPEPEPEPEPSPEEEEDEAEVRFPLPNPDATSSSFVSPSGNIACDIAERGVNCTIYDNNYAGAGFPSCAGGVTTLRASFKEAGLECAAAPVDPQSTMGVLLYGTSTVSGNYACESAETGITCWNIKSGKAIAMAREGWTAGNSGAISPGQHTW